MFFYHPTSNTYFLHSQAAHGDGLLVLAPSQVDQLNVVDRMLPAASDWDA